MQARYYDPVGRFLSTDPIGYADQVNLYTYVHNNPVNKVDPTGMSSCTFQSPWVDATQDIARRGIAGMKLAADMIVAVVNNESSNPVDDLISSTTPGESTTGRSRNQVKPGNIDTANHDFDSIVDPDSVEDRGNGVRTGKTADGRSANVRPRSTDGRPTVEIQGEVQR